MSQVFLGDLCCCLHCACLLERVRKAKVLFIILQTSAAILFYEQFENGMSEYGIMGCFFAGISGNLTEKYPVFSVGSFPLFEKNNFWRLAKKEKIA